MSVHTSLRVPYDQLQRLKANAQARGMNLTEFLILAGLFELPDEGRVSQLEQRVEKLESWRQSTIDAQGNW